MAESGLNAFSKNMACASAPEGIIVNTVTPGVFRSTGGDANMVWRWPP